MGASCDPWHIPFSFDVRGFLLLIPKSVSGCIGVNDMVRLHLSLIDNKVEVEVIERGFKGLDRCGNWDVHGIKYEREIRIGWYDIIPFDIGF
jgi:hypothetical protein